MSAITGRKLCLARKVTGYNQEYIAAKLNCSQRTISKWENGEIVLNDEIIDKYLEVLGKDREWLDTLDDRINIVQSNNVFNDNSSGVTVNNNKTSEKELNELVTNIAELAKKLHELANSVQLKIINNDK